MSRRQVVSALLLLLWLPALLWASWAPLAAAEDPEVRQTRCTCSDGRRLTYQANPDGSVYGGYLLWVSGVLSSELEWCYRECVQACGCDPVDPDLTCSKECVIGPDVPGDPAGTPTSTTTSPTMPCPEPGFFYPGINLNGYFTGAPPLAATRAELVGQLAKALQDYADQGNKITDGVAIDDAYQVAMTLRNDHSSMPTGREAGLKQAVRNLARKRQQADPDYRVSPGELFYLSLQANRGNVRDALLSCHAVLFRDSSEVNKGFVEKEGILAPLRNPDGYADGSWTFTTPTGKTRTLNPRRDLGHEEQGVWYHLFGMAALEYTDNFGAAGYEAAYYAASKGWLGLDPSVTKRGFPVSGMGGKLGDLAVALEDGIRSNQGKPPDIVKHCFNYTGLAVGAELKRLTSRIKASRTFADPGGLTTGDILRPNSTVTYRSPLSMRIQGARGEWFTFDQETGVIDGNTAALYFAAYLEDDGTWEVVAAPFFEVTSMTWTATADGPVELGLYDVATTASAVYEFTVTRGDSITAASAADTPQRNGVDLPASYTATRTVTWWPYVLVGGGVVGGLAMVALGLWALRRRTPAPTMPGGVPGWRPNQSAAPTTTCPRCGLVQPASVAFCGRCGLPNRAG